MYILFGKWTIDNLIDSRYPYQEFSHIKLVNQRDLASLSEFFEKYYFTHSAIYHSTSQMQ